MKKKSIFIIALALVFILAAAAQAEKKELNMGVLQWHDCMITSHMAMHVLEKFGYTVNEIEFHEWGIAFAALVKGDIDVLMSQVDYVTHDYWIRSKEKLEKISAVSFGLYQGLVVPSYVPIDSIEQLNEHKDKFGGKIVGIEPGSGLMRQTHAVVKEYNLDLELIDGSTPAMTAALKSAIDKKKWIVATLWTPSWMVQRFDVKFLKDPKNIQEPNQTYIFIAGKGFSQKYPMAREIIASVYVPIEAIGQIASWVNEGLSLQDAEARWIDQNKERIDRWSVIGTSKYK
jgi:glycine betaine/proline transport system substrate-binding protein